MYHTRFHTLSGKPSEVTFQDHSTESADELESSGPSSATRRSTRQNNIECQPQLIALPNPKYFRIHNAIAGVLHMSGAGGFLDEIIKEYDRSGGSSKAVPVGDDLWEYVLRLSLQQLVVSR